MTASVANGFGHILYTPKSKTCQESPYAFHPEYSTANPRGNTWSAHTYNVAMSDEIGHFENCLAINARGRLHQGRRPGPEPGRGRQRLRAGNRLAAGAHRRLLQPWMRILTGSHTARTGRAPTRMSPRTGPCTRHRSCSPARSPTGGTTRRSPSRPTCRGSRHRTRRPTRRSATGHRRELREPAARCAVLPVLLDHERYGSCTWQEGGKFLPGTTNDFGGSSTTEFGPLLKTVYPKTGFTTEELINNFNSGNMANPCRVR